MILISVTAFTIERYVAICHPFISHTMSKLSRAVKYIFLIWILSVSFAVPQALQTGIVSGENGAWCTVVEERVFIKHSFELATVLFFFAPMSLITILYILIGVKLRSSTMIKRENGSVQRNNNLTSNIHQNASQSTKRVLKMLGKSLPHSFFAVDIEAHKKRPINYEH
jgi:neuromedin U receptor 1